MSALGLDTLSPLDSAKPRKSTADRYVNRVDKRVSPTTEYVPTEDPEREPMNGPLLAGSSISWGALWPNQPVPKFRRM